MNAHDLHTMSDTALLVAHRDALTSCGCIAESLIDTHDGLDNPDLRRAALEAHELGDEVKRRLDQRRVMFEALGQDGAA